jgi:hypothetical protein
MQQSRISLMVAGKEHPANFGATEEIPEPYSILEGPLLVFVWKGHSRIEDVVQVFHHRKQFSVLASVSEVFHQESRKLVKTIESASNDHVYQLLGREGDSRWLYYTRPILESTNEHECLRNVAHASHPHRNVLTVVVLGPADMIRFDDHRA